MESTRMDFFDLSSQSKQIIVAVVVVSFIVLYMIKFFLDERAKDRTFARFNPLFSAQNKKNIRLKERLFSLTSIDILRIIAWSLFVLGLMASIMALWMLPSKTEILLGSRPELIRHYVNVFIALMLVIGSSVIPVFLMVIAGMAENIQYLRDRYAALLPAETPMKVEIEQPGVE